MNDILHNVNPIIWLIAGAALFLIGAVSLLWQIALARKRGQGAGRQAASASQVRRACVLLQHNRQQSKPAGFLYDTGLEHIFERT